MSGFISFLFTLLFSVALTLAIVFWQEKKRRLAKIFGILSFVCAIVAVVAGAVYYLRPARPLIQTVGPPEKPYVFIKDSELEPLIAGKNPVVKFALQNGPIESVVTFTNVSFALTRFVPEKYLKYLNAEDPGKTKLAPRQVITQRWTFFALVLTQDDIDELNAEKPTAELYFFARGEYTDETGKHPFDFCRKYDKAFPNHLVFCGDDLKIE